MILIYTHTITERLKFILNLIFAELLGVDFQLTTDVAKFKLSGQAKINYSNKFLETENEVFIQANSLLFETEIKDKSIELQTISEWNLLPAFFLSTEKSFLPFDIFAASFYLVSRYEEYLPFEADKFGRFPAEKSLAFQLNFLEKPLVNLWVKHFAMELKKQFPQLQIRQAQFRYQPTIDIDNAFAYLHKGFARTIGAVAKSLILLNFSDNFRRIKTILGFEKDAFDSYDFQRNIHKKYKLTPIYFFIVGKYGNYDKNISHKNKAFRTLIKSLSLDYEIGIHPSYSSNSDFAQLKNEYNELQKIISKPIAKSRQHYLKLRFPETYRNLLKLGISEDYTMGYASAIGFRASICSPFQFFDLEANCATLLRIFPFQVMDETLNEYLKLSPESAIEKIENLVKEVKNVNGLFISLWHNESLGNSKRWENWQNVYETMLAVVFKDVKI